MARPAHHAAPTNLRVVDETTAAAEGRYEELVSSAGLNRRLLHGPFATNVWGGRYAIDAFGGEGSQGTTLSGIDLKTGTRVAVKLFDLGGAKDWKSQDLFDREVQTLQKLRHAGIPQFLDVLNDDETGARALVMTFIAGDSLKAVLKRDGAVLEKRLWTLLVDVANVLAAVHGAGVVHRDLKPENLILRPDGSVAVVDFGGVGFARASAGSTVVGTFGYMAPEQLYGAQTPATDLYALGATVLTLATATEPEDQPRNGLAVDVDAAAPFLSPPLRTLLTKMLAPDPNARPRDAAALLAELKGISTHSTSTKPHNPNVDRSAKVDALWYEDKPVDNAVTALEGGLGILAALIGTFATIGIGRMLLPFLFTVIGLFLGTAARRDLRLVRGVVERRAQQLQAEMKKGGLHSAQRLEELATKDRRRREHRQRRKSEK